MFKVHMPQNLDLLYLTLKIDFVAESLHVKEF